LFYGDSQEKQTPIEEPTKYGTSANAPANAQRCKRGLSQYIWNVSMRYSLSILPKFPKTQVKKEYKVLQSLPCHVLEEEEALNEGVLVDRAE